MSYDDDSYGYSDRYSHGRGGYGSSHDRKSTPELTADSLLQGDKFLGIPLSAGGVKAAKMLYSSGLAVFRDGMEGKIATGAYKLFQEKYPHWGEAKAFERAKTAGSVAGWAAIFSPQIIRAVSAVYNAASSMSELQQNVGPLLKANGDNPYFGAIMGGTGSGLVSKARQQIVDALWHELGSTLVSTDFVNVYLKMSNKPKFDEKIEEKLKNEKRSKMTPQERAKSYAEEMKNTAMVHKNVNEVVEEALKPEKAEYLKKWEEFRSKHRGELKGKEHDMPKFNFEFSHDAVQKFKASQKSSSGGETLDQQQEKIRKLHREFINEHKSWSNYHLDGRGDYGRGELIEGLEAHIRKRFKEDYDAIRKAELEAKSSKSKELDERHLKDTPLYAFIGGAGALVSELIAGMVGHQAKETLDQDTALKLLLHMRQELEKDPKRTTIALPAKEGKGKGKGYGDYGDGVGFVQYIDKIVQQYRKDFSWTPIAGSEVAHFMDAKWRDEDIQRLEDHKLTPYEVFLKRMAADIVNGQTDPMAIGICLDRGLVVSRDGKRFGPNKLPPEEKRCREDMGKLVDSLSTDYVARRKMSEDELNEVKSELTLSPEQIQATFKAQDLATQAVLFGLLDRRMQDKAEVRALLGMDEALESRLRKKCQDCLSPVVSAALVDLAHTLEETPEFTKQLRLSDRKKEEIVSLAESVERDGKDPLEGAGRGEEGDVTLAVFNAATEKPDMLKKWMTESKPLAEKIKEIRAQKEEGEDKEERKSGGRRGKYHDEDRSFEDRDNGESESRYGHKSRKHAGDDENPFAREDKPWKEKPLARRRHGESYESRDSESRGWDLN